MVYSSHTTNDLFNSKLYEEITNLRNDELVGEETDSRQDTINEKGNGCDWIDCGVHISKPFKPL